MDINGSILLQRIPRKKKNTKNLEHINLCNNYVLPSSKRILLQFTGRSLRPRHQFLTLVADAQLHHTVLTREESHVTGPTQGTEGTRKPPFRRKDRKEVDPITVTLNGQLLHLT